MASREVDGPSAPLLDLERGSEKFFISATGKRREATKRVLDVALHHRVIYAESAAQGLSVLEAAPTSGAALEITLLGKALLAFKQQQQVAVA